MNDDDRIKDLLDSTAPDRPDLPPAARTTAVRDRARAVSRRHRVAVAAAVVAVVGVGVGVPVLTSGGDDPSGTEVAGDPAPVVAPEPTPPPCPAEPVDVSAGVVVDALPDGAISVRACPTTDQPALAPGDLPTEPLVEGVDDFTAGVRDLPAYVLEEECAFTTMMAQPWALVVSYRDGTSAVLGSTMRSCATVPVESVDRSAQAVLDLFVDASDRQVPTPGGGTTGEVPGIPCPDPARFDDALTAPDSYTGDLRDFTPVAGVACYVPDPQGAREYAADEGGLSADQAQLLADDLAARTTSEASVDGLCTDSGPTRVVVLVDAEGVGVTRVDRSCTSEFTGGGTWWLAGDAAEAVIDDALGGRLHSYS